MRLRLWVNILALVIFIFVLSLGLVIAQENTPFLGEINANNINLRSDATTTSQVICTLNKGEEVKVVLEFYEWYKVHLPDRISLYLKGSLADCIKYQEGIEDNKNVCLSAKVLVNRVNLRVSPSESAPIVGIADKNEIINVKGEAGGWYKIEPIQNSFGWINKKFVNKALKITHLKQNTP